MMQKLFFLISFIVMQQSTFAKQAISVKTLSEKGQPLLFLPHIGCSSDMWKEIAEKYQNTNACYLIDFAGFAGMAPLKGDYTETYVEGIRKFIKEKQLTNCILIGQNYGGYVAVKLAEAIPDEVGALILSDFYPKLSMVLGPDISKGQLDTVLNSIRIFNRTADTASFAAYQKQTADAMNFTNPVMADKFVLWQQLSDRATLAGTLTEQMQEDLIPFFKKNKIPALVYTTWYFAIKYKNMPLEEAPNKLDEMYPGAQKVTHAITDASKDFMANDQPEWFAKQLDQFLKLTAGAK